MAYRSLPDFNPEARFVANRAFTFNGRLLSPGDLVAGVPERRLRQLFELRKVAVAPEEPKQPAAVHGAARKGKK